jgi:hypothetical protein
MSKEACDLYDRYSRETRNGQVLTRTDPNLIRVIRELGVRANQNGGNWVVINLDDRYSGDNHRFKGNGRVEWLEVRDGSEWVTYPIE